jgi:deoxycytidylate deaminase
VIDSKLSETVRNLALSADSRWRVGCVLLRKGRVVVATTNAEGKTHPRQKLLAHRVNEPYRTSLHAELRALLKAREAVDTLVVGRVDRNGKLCMSRPCPVCQLAISEYGIGRVVYSGPDGSWLELPARHELQ